MNPKYRVRKLSCEKPNIIGGKEDLLWSLGKRGLDGGGVEGVEPILLTENLWGNVK